MLANFIFDHLPEDKRQEFFVIFGMRQVFAESLRLPRSGRCGGSEYNTLTRSKDLRTLSFCALKKLPTATDIARSTSSARTYSRRCILALASAILVQFLLVNDTRKIDITNRIILSKCLTVIGKLPVAKLSLLRSAKSRASFSLSKSCSLGWTFSRA